MRRLLGRLTGRERRSGDLPYTEALADAFESAASRSATADATAALETAAGAYGRAFAVARVSPAGPRTAWLSPATLNAIGRQLVRRGELVARLEVARGRVEATIAGSWDVRGESAARGAWTYQVTEYGPSGSSVRWLPAAACLHLQWAYDPARPWWGLSPLHVAAADGRLHAATVEALADEAGGPRGSLLPIPADGEDGMVTTLKSKIAELRGRVAVVETTAAGWGDGPSAAPRKDWSAQRLGFDAPDTLRNLRSDSARAVLAACGVPVELVAASEGTGAREAYRRFLFGSVLPLARMVERELEEKIEADVRLDFSELMAADLAGRARAFQSMVGAGMDLDRAAALAGLLEPEAS